jgi:glycosyltransferase involved in cell wall biosynthesis
MAALTPATSKHSGLAKHGARISVLMPTLNGSAFLQEQLESLLAQTRLPDCLLVSDDGSTDSTLAYLHSFAARAPFRVRILRGPGRGAAANVLSLIASAPPGALALCDQDDVWMPEKLARARRALMGLPRETPALYAGARIVTNRKLAPKGPIKVYPFVPDFPSSLRQNPAAGNTILLNGAAARLARFALRDLDTIPPFHDWWLCQLVLGCGGTALLDPVPQVLYRQHRHNLIGAGFGLRAGLQRIKWLVDGTYHSWASAQADALFASRNRLTPFAYEHLQQFRTGQITPEYLSRNPWLQIALNTLHAAKRRRVINC